MMDSSNWVLSKVPVSCLSLDFLPANNVYTVFGSDNRLEVPITLHSFKGMAEEVTLVDSGATENFIDQETIKKLKLGSKKLSEPI
jgi:hypothetical protein